MNNRLGPIDIGASPVLLDKVGETFRQLDELGEEIGFELSEELGPVGALMIIMSAHGAAILNIFANQAMALGIEWDKQERKEFGMRLQALLQEQNQKLVGRSTGDHN